VQSTAPRQPDREAKKSDRDDGYNDIREAIDCLVLDDNGVIAGRLLRHGDLQTGPRLSTFTADRRERAYAAWTLTALGPFSPASASYVTFAPSASER